MYVEKMRSLHFSELCVVELCAIATNNVRIYVCRYVDILYACCMFWGTMHCLEYIAAHDTCNAKMKESNKRVYTVTSYIYKYVFMHVDMDLSHMPISKRLDHLHMYACKSYRVVHACIHVHTYMYICMCVCKLYYIKVCIYFFPVCIPKLPWAVCQLHVLPIVRLLGNRFCTYVCMYMQYYALLTTQTQCR